VIILEGEEKRKHQRMQRLLFLIINIAALSGLVWFLFTDSDLSADQSQSARLIGACYMTMNNPYYEIVNEEIRAVVEEHGDILVTRNPAMDSGKQVQQIRDLLNMGVSAIIVTPVDWKAAGPALSDAREQGVLVIVVDASLYEEEMADCTVVSDNYQAGVLCAEQLMASAPSARIVLLEHSSAKSSLDRIAGFEQTLAGHEGYEVVARGECDGQLEVAMPVMNEILRSGVKFDTVFALNDPSAMGAMAAMEDVGVREGIQVYGVDGAPEAKAMIREGMMAATVAQFPTQIGRAAAENMYRLLAGEECEPLVLAPVSLITRDNVESYGIDRWQ